LCCEEDFLLLFSFPEEIPLFTFFLSLFSLLFLPYIEKEDFIFLKISFQEKSRGVSGMGFTEGLLFPLALSVEMFK